MTSKVFHWGIICAFTNQSLRLKKYLVWSLIICLKWILMHCGYKKLSMNHKSFVKFNVVISTWIQNHRNLNINVNVIFNNEIWIYCCFHIVHYSHSVFSSRSRVHKVLVKCQLWQWTININVTAWKQLIILLSYNAYLSNSIPLWRPSILNI